jgi:glycosyltransferase involved in cell wall biosynthesis
MKKILVIAYSFPPLGSSASLRTLKFVKYMPNLDWQPLVLTVKHGLYFYGSNDMALLQQLPKEIKVYRANPWLRPKRCEVSSSQISPAKRAYFFTKIISALKSAIKSFLFVPDKRILWMFPALLQARRIFQEEEIGLIFSTSDIYVNHLIGWLIKRISGLPWVADFQDPWTQNPYRHWSNRLQRMVEGWLERKVIKAADVITSTTESITQGLIAKYPMCDAAKFVTIASGYDPEDFQGITRKNSEKFIITHIGSLYGPRTAEGFLVGLGQLLREQPQIRPDVEILFIGTSDASNKELIASLSKNYSLEGVLKEVDRVSHHDCLGYVVNSDVLLLITDSGKAGEALIPAKLFEYLYACLPILALVPEGESARLIRATKSGVTVNPEDIASIKQAISDFYTSYKRGILDLNQDTSLIAPFDSRKLTKKLSGIFDGLVGEKR